MNQNVQNHIDAKVAEIRDLFEKAASRIEAIAIGEKIPATILAETLAKEIGMTGPQLYPTLKMLFTDYPGVKIQRGAHGGIYRPKVEEAKVETVADVAVETPASSDSDAEVTA